MDPPDIGWIGDFSRDKTNGKYPHNTHVVLLCDGVYMTINCTDGVWGPIPDRGGSNYMDLYINLKLGNINKLIV